jgi:hypothetical protein
MSDWPYTVVMLVPAAIRESANQLAAGLDHGPNNFSVPLSATGAEPPTHFGSRAQAQQSFIDLLTAVGQGELPIIQGMTPQEVGTVLMQLQADVNVGVDGYAHFNQVIDAAGLKRMEPQL